MRKRLTSPNKWDDDWYLELPPKYKCVWEYICNTCDGGTGFKKISFKKISDLIGDKVDREEFDRYIGDRVHWVNHEVIWVYRYLAEQFKELKPTIRAHVNMAKLVIKTLSSQPLSDKASKVYEMLEDVLRQSPDSHPTVTRESPDSQVTVIGNREQGIGNREQGKISEGGVGETIAAPVLDPTLPTPAQVEKCGKAWIESLRSLGIQNREGIRSDEEIEIFRAIRAHGEETVYLALVGARYQKKTEKWDPKDYPSIVRIIAKDKTGVCKISQFADLALARQKPVNAPGLSEIDEYERQLADTLARLKHGS